MKQYRLKPFFPVLLALFLALAGGAAMAFGQTAPLSGTVLDEFGDPMMGVTVKVNERSGVGALTDLDGKFTLQVNPSETLSFSYVGYKTLTFTVSQIKANPTIQMAEDQELLDEVVVVGYAKGSRRTISGAVAQVSAEDMNAGQVVNPLQSLQGKVAGVNIRKVGGDPTAAPSIRIRGTTSLSGGNDPLVIIDGVFGDLALLNTLNPSDIETFSILKDASETAQYGSRGAAGVVVVTTKKGKSGRYTLTYDGSFGIETPFKTIEMLDAAGYRRAIADLGITTAVDGGASTNFMQEMLQTGYTQNHQIAFGGGSEQGSFRASLGLVDQKGIVRTSGMQNFTAKIDGTQRFFEDKLQLDLGLFGSRRENRYVNDYQKTFYSAASSNPTLPVAQNEDGTWPEDPNANEIDNPLGRLTINDRGTEAFLTATGRVTYHILPGFDFSAFGSYTYINRENSKYIPNNIKAGIRAGRGEAYRGNNRNDNFLGNLTLSYTNTLGKHRIDALAVAEGQRYNNRGFGVTAHGFDTNFFEFNNLAAGALLKYGDASSYDNGYSLNSYLARVNYIYDDRYIVTLNARADGSSKLGENYKWGFFPSGSFAWSSARKAL